MECRVIKKSGNHFTRRFFLRSAFLKLNTGLFFWCVIFSENLNIIRNNSMETSVSILFCYFIDW